MRFYWILMLSGIFFVACKQNERDSSMVEGRTGLPAIDQITTKLESNPNDVSLLLARAELFYKNEGYDEAILDMNRAIKLDSLKPKYYLFLSQILMDYAKSKESLQVLEFAADRFPDSLNVLLQLGKYQHILKQHPASLTTIDKVLLRDPQHAEAYLIGGLNFYEMTDTVRAINSFQKAVDMDPDLVSGWLHLAKLWEGRGPVLAKKYYQTAIAIDSSNIGSLQAYALFLGNQDEFQQSIDLYRKIALIDHNYAPAYFNAGLMYMMMDSVQPAYRQFDLAVKFEPTFAEAYYYRGYASQQLGDVVTAQKDYEQALNLKPDYKKAHRALSELGQ